MLLIALILADDKVFRGPAASGGPQELKFCVEE